MTLDAPARPAIEAGPRIAVSRGLITVTVAVVALFVASAVIAPTSISRGALLGMLPFAAVLAIAAIGQTLVVQQGGIDLSVPGAISLAVIPRLSIASTAATPLTPGPSPRRSRPHPARLTAKVRPAPLPAPVMTTSLHSTQSVMSHPPLLSLPGATAAVPRDGSALNTRSPALNAYGTASSNRV